MQLQQLIYFVTVAEQGSFNKAAEKLFTTQPNLSKAINNLETDLNVNIFERTNKGVKLTDEGKKLYQYAKTIINQIELINGLASDEAVKMLSVATYPIITMGRLVSDFYNSHRNEKIAIKLVERRLYEVIEMVENGEAEIGFIMSKHVQDKELRHMLKFKGLELHMLGIDTWYVNVGPSHPFYDREEVTMAEMLDFPFVRLPDDYFSNLTHYLEIDGVRLTNFTNTIYVNDTAAILAFLTRTDAFRFGPSLSTKDFKAHGVKTIPIKNCNIKITVGWIQKKKEILSPEAKEFVKQLEALYHI